MPESTLDEDFERTLDQIKRASEDQDRMIRVVDERGVDVKLPPIKDILVEQLEKAELRAALAEYDRWRAGTQFVEPFSEVLDHRAAALERIITSARKLV